MKEDANPTIEVRQGEGLDADRLGAYLRNEMGDLGEGMAIAQYPSGKSNLTYLLTFTGRSLVLRRPPLGTKAITAHDMSREFNVLRALKPHYPWVPQVELYCSDESVLGTAFYLMERVAGRLLPREIPPAWNWSVQDHRRLCTAFWDRLIALHRLDYRQVNLGGLARPEGYARRQIEGWNRRFDRARTADAPEASDVMEWLARRIPEDETPVILHNDYRMDNVIWNQQDPFQVQAVVDWEMAAVGHPLMDLGNSLAYWVEAGDDAAAREAASQPSDLPGMFSRRGVVDYYREKTGRPVEHIEFFYVAGMFRLAAIIQQIYYRYDRGETQDSRFDGWITEVHRLVRRCQSVIAGARWSLDP